MKCKTTDGHEKKPGGVMFLPAERRRFNLAYADKENHKGL
jgi:hypothetical protein